MSERKKVLLTGPDKKVEMVMDKFKSSFKARSNPGGLDDQPVAGGKLHR